MAVTAVFFDVGETLVDEERVWREVAAAAGLRPHVVWAALGMTIERGEEHWDLWRHLETERPPDAWTRIGYERGDLFPDALPCLEQMRASGRLVGIAGNQSAEMEEWARSLGLPVDVVTSSAALGVRKPEPGFFARLVELSGRVADEVAYVGDRVDNDVLPALEAGLVAVHVRRGPWGLLQPTPDGVAAIEALSELAPVLDRLASGSR